MFQYLWLSLPTNYCQGLRRCSAVQSKPCKVPGTCYSLDRLPELICVCSRYSLIPVQSHCDLQERLATSFVRPHAKWKCKVPHFKLLRMSRWGQVLGPSEHQALWDSMDLMAVKLALPARVNGRTGVLLWTVTDFLTLGFRITADDDCSHEIKRCLVLKEKL